MILPLTSSEWMEIIIPGRFILPVVEGAEYNAEGDIACGGAIDGSPRLGPMMNTTMHGAGTGRSVQD